MDRSGPGGRNTRRASLLSSIAALATRRPRLVIVAWLLSMVVLAAVGMDVDSKVSTKPIYVDGSASERAHDVAVREFGGEDALVLMLRGPRGEVNQQGRALVQSLEAVPRTLVISPWSSGGSLEGLRPSPRVAAVLVSVGQAKGGVEWSSVPVVERIVAETVKDPVRISVAGGPAIIDSLRKSVARAAAFGEKLALPLLLIVLLFVCRSLLAAAMPVVIGGLVVGATRGVLDAFAGIVTIDAFALGTAGMLGLALGIDYSLLIVSRFRQEMEVDGDVERAVQTTVTRTGRSILPAGLGLILAMFASVALLPGALILSVAIAVVAATVLSMIAAIFFAPAALALLGARLDRWSLPRRRESGSLVLGWSQRLSHRAPVVLGMIFVLMLCGAWAFTLQTSTGTASLLSPDDPGRVQQEEIERDLGPGWVAPFEVVMDGGGRPVTTRARLRALASFQRKVERDPGVVAMAGFAGLQRTTEQLGGAEASLARQQRGLTRLDRGLAQARDGAAAMNGKLGRASGGAVQLAVATDETQRGSGRLTSGLQSSAEGSNRLSGGLGRVSDGSGRLTAATSKASGGADRLASGVEEAQERSGEAVSSAGVLKRALLRGEEELKAVDGPLGGAEAQLAAAWQALQKMTSGRSDSEYTAAMDAVRAANRELTGAEPGAEEPSSDEGVGGGVRRGQDQFSLGIYLAEQQRQSSERARDGVERLAKASGQLDDGLQRLLESSRKMTDGIAQLSHGSDLLSPGLQQLASGAERLTGGLGTLATGAGGLAGGLATGAQKSQRLTSALGRMHTGVEEQQGPGGSLFDRLDRQSPGLFHSGYFYLAGLDGTRPDRRNQVGFLVNLDSGGSAARMLVVPSDPPASSGVAETGDRLTADAADLARQTGSKVEVGGLPPALEDLDSALRDEAPFLRLALSLVTLLILIPVTRSLTLPILAALLNLLTVSATFGLLALLFNDSLLGGPGFVDTVAIPAAVILTFGLAIDYEVFIFARIREEYLRTGSTPQAIDRGFGRLAHVISGAAVIMIAVFLAFSVSPLANLRNLGVALAIGVFIDAFVIRLVVLPALMRALGDRCWWVPRWLGWVLPGSVPAGARS